MMHNAQTEIPGKAGYLKGRLLNGLFVVVLLWMPATAPAESGFLPTPNGAFYKDLRPGSGEPAQIGDVATMHFTGWLDAGGGQGRELYNTRREGRPVSFVIGTERVMAGWNEGVIGMREGGRRLVRVPPALGFGQKGVDGFVPPNTGLVFMIDLLAVEKKDAR